MIRDLLALNIGDIGRGYSYDADAQKYICHVCGKVFERGEIFRFKDRFYDAGKIIKLHIEHEHPDMLNALMDNKKKYTGITDNQKKLLIMMADGMTDNEIAKQLGIAPGTVRHQKFMFREKAKQAKLFLAIYELAMSSNTKNKQKPEVNKESVKIHRGATMIDDRYSVTTEENGKILNNFFISLEPLKLKTFSAKEKNKIVILRRIAEQFDKERRYSEKEVNAVLESIYEDFATIRRYMIEYGFMQRTKDCSEYWIK